jgi:hypothetical protein
MVLDGGKDGHAWLPVPAYVPDFAPMARLRLSKAPIQTNVQLCVAYTQRWCTRGCAGIADTKHHLLLECPAVADMRAAFTDNELCTESMVI